MVAVVAVLLGIYLGWLLTLFVVIYRQDEDLRCPIVLPSATVLVAFRNEEHALPGLLSSLVRQAHEVPLLAIDDYSNDASSSIIEKFQTQYPDQIQYRSSSAKPGKRTALAAAIPGVSTDWVLQTDADCIPERDWTAQTLAAIWNRDTDMAILPLRFRSPHLSAFWLSVVNTEFASVMAVTCGMARLGRPVMCNGANLAFRKSLWEAAAPHLARQIHAGGDDMFLLDYAVRCGAKVSYCDAPAVWVETEAPASFRSFFAQRQRWAAKWTAYQSPWPYVVGLVSLLGQAAFIAAPWLLALGQGGWVLAATFTAKLGLEGLLLRRQLHKGQMDFHAGAFLFWQVFYLPYVLVSVLPSLWTRPPAQWKN